MLGPEVLIGLRWIHFVAGITWIGLLYWFNLVNVPFQRVLDPALKGQVTPPLFRRALAWFRWRSATTSYMPLRASGIGWQAGGWLAYNVDCDILLVLR